MRSQILAVQKMQDYIEAHLTEEITLAVLADICSFSPWYAHRLFREHTGYAPAEYVRRMRLAKSALRLKTEQTKIIDVAFDLGFASVDGYTRAFRKEFGINPGEYAKSPVPIKLFVAYGVKFKELRKEYSLMENANVFIQVIHKPRRKVIIKRGIKADNYFDYCGEVGCDVWGTLLSMDSLCGEPVCLWLPEQYKLPETSTYVQEELAEHLNRAGAVAIACETIEDGVKMALQEAGDTGVVLCFGSLYTIGAIKEALDSI